MGKLEDTQEAVEEVKGIMLDNLDKEAERKEKLEDLDQRAAALLNKSVSFRKQAKQAKQKERKEYLKSKAAMIAFMVVLALVILIVIAIMFSSRNSTDTSTERSAVTSKPNITDQL